MSSRIESAAKQARDALKMLDELMATHERFGGVEPEVGTALRFEHKFDHNPKSYTYIAYRSVNGWHVSGRPFAGHVADWDDLVEFIGDAKCFRFAGEDEIVQLHPDADADKNAKLDALTDLLSSGLDARTLAERLLELTQ